MLIEESQTEPTSQSESLFGKTSGVKSRDTAVLASNMVSKHYCPKCESFNLKRIHRGYFAKHVFKKSPLYQCTGCGEQTAEADLSMNETKDIPIFIEEDYPVSPPLDPRSTSTSG